MKYTKYNTHNLSACAFVSLSFNSFYTIRVTPAKLGSRVKTLIYNRYYDDIMLPSNQLAASENDL